MTGQRVFPPRELYGFAADAQGWADDVRTAGEDVRTALHRFTASSSEFVPQLAAHEPAISSLAEQTQALAQDVALLGAAAEEADRIGVADFRHLALTVATGIRLADTATSVPHSVLRLLRTSVHGTRAVSSASQQWRLARRYGNRPMPDISRIRSETPGGQTMPRRDIRQVQLDKYRALKRTRARWRNVRADSLNAVRGNRPLTRFGERVRSLMETRTGRVVSTGGRVLGVAGAALSFADAGAGIYEGNTERAITGTIAGVGGVLLLTSNPVTVGIGAVVVVGVTVYENWDTITDWGASAVDTVSDFGSSVLNGARDLLDGIF